MPTLKRPGRVQESEQEEDKSEKPEDPKQEFHDNNVPTTELNCSHETVISDNTIITIGEAGARVVVPLELDPTEKNKLTKKAGPDGLRELQSHLRTVTSQDAAARPPFVTTY